MCSGDTSGHMNSCRRLVTHLRVFQTRSSSQARATISPTGKVRRCEKCPAQANEVASWTARFRPGNWFFFGIGSEKLGNTIKNDHLDELALKMVGKYFTSKHPVFKCSNMLQTGASMKRKKRGGSFCAVKIRSRTRYQSRFNPPLSN